MAKYVAPAAQAGGIFQTAIGAANDSMEKLKSQKQLIVDAESQLQSPTIYKAERKHLILALCDFIQRSEQLHKDYLFKELTAFVNTNQERLLDDFLYPRKTESALGKTESALGKTESALGKTESASGKTESALGKTESASGKTESASGKTESAVQPQAGGDPQTAKTILNKAAQKLKERIDSSNENKNDEEYLESVDNFMKNIYQKVIAQVTVTDMQELYSPIRTEYYNYVDRIRRDHAKIIDDAYKKQFDFLVVLLGYSSMKGGGADAKLEPTTDAERIVKYGNSLFIDWINTSSDVKSIEEKKEHINVYRTQFAENASKEFMEKLNEEFDKTYADLDDKLTKEKKEQEKKEKARLSNLEKVNACKTTLLNAMQKGGKRTRRQHRRRFHKKTRRTIHG